MLVFGGKRWDLDDDQIDATHFFWPFFKTQTCVFLSVTKILLLSCVYVEWDTYSNEGRF